MFWLCMWIYPARRVVTNSSSRGSSKDRGLYTPLGDPGMWPPRSWRLGLEAVSRRSSASARSRLGVGTPRPRLGLELWMPCSRSRLGLNCQRLGLGLGLGLGLELQGLGLASVSTKKASCTSLGDKTWVDCWTVFCVGRCTSSGWRELNASSSGWLTYCARLKIRTRTTLLRHTSSLLNTRRGSTSEPRCWYDILRRYKITSK